MPQDPKHVILVFDTAGPFIRAAVARGSEVLETTTVDMAKGQAEALFGILESLLSAAETTWADLAAVGVGIGPGNFTGIRLAVSAARGIGLSLDIPVVGVSGLEMALAGQKEPVLAALAAPRGQFYVQKTDEEPVLALPSDIPKSWCIGMTCVGPDAQALADATGLPICATAMDPLTAMVSITAKKWSTTTSAAKPLYIKPPDAAPSATQPRIRRA